MSTLLDSDALGKLKDERRSWLFEADNKAMTREIKFIGFGAAIGFIVQVAIQADKMNHHPEWSNVYSYVKIRLTTHDKGGITKLDETLSGHIDKIALQLGASNV